MRKKKKRISHLLTSGVKMLIVDLLHCLKKHLMKSDDSIAFMRTLIQMLCDIPEEAEDGELDPSSPLRFTDSSLRKIYSSGFNKKISNAILSNLSSANFIDAINEGWNDDVLENLCNDLKEYDREITKGNLGKRLFSLLENCLLESADTRTESEKKLVSARNNSEKAKKNFGESLLIDCNFKCSIENCGHSLITILSDGESSAKYEIITLSKKRSLQYKDLLCVCNDCFQQYTLHCSPEEHQKLLTLKQVQMNRRTAMLVLDDASLHKNISKLLSKLSEMTELKETQLNYDPVSVSKKLDGTAPFVFVDMIKTYVRYYFATIDSIMKDLARQNLYNDNLIRAQIREAFLSLEEKGIPPQTIFDNMVGWIQNLTKQNEQYCILVVAYFIQSCEVFHVITE